MGPRRAQNGVGPPRSERWGRLFERNGSRTRVTSKNHLMEHRPARARAYVQLF
jgi:hypothetical protein